MKRLTGPMLRPSVKLSSATMCSYSRSRDFCRQVELWYISYQFNTSETEYIQGALSVLKHSQKTKLHSDTMLDKLWNNAWKWLMSWHCLICMLATFDILLLNTGICNWKTLGHCFRALYQINVAPSYKIRKLKSSTNVTLWCHADLSK